jgi:hypothetical protein
MIRILDKAVTNNYKIDYTFEFSCIANSDGNVQFIDHRKNKKITVEIILDDKNFQHRVSQEFPSILADLTDLAVAIHSADRLAVQPFDQEQKRILIVLPVRHPELLNKDSFKTKLEYLLEWATGSRWFFDFQKRNIPGRIVEQQQTFPTLPQECEVTLWSGGLDAFSGLYTRLISDSASHFMLFGTGSNNSVSALQKKVFKELQPFFPNRINLCQVPIRFCGGEEHEKNKHSRARGVVFIMLGSVCAYLMGQKILHLYENGIGAINLPYRKSAIGLDHSRSVHPLTLLMISELVSELLGEKFHIKNPFLFWTKAQMCKALAHTPLSDVISVTQSCDRRHRQQPTQCGYCSSCILRRQAIAASKIKDKTLYVILHGKSPVSDPKGYFLNMLCQVSTFRDLFSVSEDPDCQWARLTQKFLLDDIVDRCAKNENLSLVEMRHHLLNLYKTYVTEWSDVESHLSVGLLHKLTNQS